MVGVSEKGEKCISGIQEEDSGGVRGLGLGQVGPGLRRLVKLMTQTAFSLTGHLVGICGLAEAMWTQSPANKRISVPTLLQSVPCQT